MFLWNIFEHYLLLNLSIRVAKPKKKYHSESLVKDCIKDDSQQILDESVAMKIAQLPLFNDSVAQFIK